MANANLSGQPLGQYELREMIGIGGMGAVYLGYQRALDRLVAVKVMQFSLTHGGNFAQRFEREAKTAAALEHPHIVPVIDYGFDQGTSYIVMRYLSGGTLSQRLRQRMERGESPPSLGEIARLLSQVASALDYAHHQKVIHRDIKTSNIMFDNHGEAYLVDFGIAKLTESSAELTMTGVALGTAHYMAPEQVKGQALTPATDQYALAVVIYALVAGRMPFEAATPFAVQQRHISDMPTPVHTYRPQTPEAVTLVLERALAKDPNGRFPTVTAFAQAFQSAIAGQEGEATGFFTFKVQQERPDIPETVLPLGTPPPPYQHQPTVIQPPPPSGPTPVQPNTSGGRKSPLVWVMGGIILVLTVIVGVLLVSMGGGGEPLATAIIPESPTIVIVVPSDTATLTPDTTTIQASATPSQTPSLTFTPSTTATNTASPTSSATHTNTPTRTPTVTNTLTLTASPTSSPTPTAQPARIVMPDVEVTFRDDFDRATLSSVLWGNDGLRPRTENGQLVMIGGNSGATVTRCCLGENEGVLVLFQPIAGQIGMSLVSRDFDSAERRRWAFESNTGTDWNALYRYDRQEVRRFPITMAYLQLNHWYYLLMRVGENGRFYTLVWDRDHPSQYLANVSRTPFPIGGWEGRSWTFELGGTTSRVLVESYEELRFPADYTMPETPPITTSAGVVTTATPQAVDCWWTEDFTAAPPASAYAYGPQTSVSSAADNLLLLQSRGGIGRFYNREKVTSGNEWAIAFDFQVAHGDSGTSISQIADGFMFAFVPSIPTSASDSASGGALGFVGGSGFRYGVEFDLWQNSEFNDTTAHHIALLEQSVGNHIRRRGWSLQLNTWYHAEIRMDNSRIIVLIDDEIMVNGTVSYNPNQEGYFGFSASSGDYNEQIRLDNIQMCSGVTDIADALRVPFAATIAPTATPTRTPRPTHAPTARPTNTPRPTATPLPTSAVMPGGVEVTFTDEFNGSILSGRWSVWNLRPQVSDGMMVFEGRNSWEDGIVRGGITENEGIQLLFQYDGTLPEIELNLQKGIWNSNSWRRWTLSNYSGWQAASENGRSPLRTYARPVLRTNTWYYLLFRIGDDGTLYTQVWQRDNPTRYLVNIAEAPSGGGWDGGTWEFVLKVNRGTLTADTYQELRFPADYEMPGTPPPTPTTRTYEVQVSSTRLWPSTNIEVEAGDQVTITYLRGTWRLGQGFALTDASGGFNNSNNIYGTNARHGALIARVGRSGTVYTIGNSRSFTAGTNGTLLLSINDDVVSDNSGTITVQVEVEAPPATATPTPSRTPRPAATRTPTPTPRASTSTFLGVMFEQDFTQTTNLGVSGSGRRTIEDGNGIWCMASTSEYRNVTFGSDTWTDYAVDLNIRITPRVEGHGAILTRLNSSSHGYRHAVFIWSSSSWASQYYYPVDSNLGGANVNVHSGEWHHLRAEVEGSAIRTFVDEVLIAAQNSGLRSRGYAAVEAAPGSSVCIDDIVVRSLNRSNQAVANARRGTATGNVNMRSGAGTGFSRVSGLTNGEEVFILDYNANRSWVYVRKIDSPIQGWVSADYIR